MRIILILLLLGSFARSQEFNASTTPTPQDTERLSLQKAVKLLNDAKTGTSPLTTAPSATSATSANQALEISGLSGISGKLPATLGAKTSALSLSVVPASDSTYSIGGPLAAGAVATGNPVRIGVVARTSSSYAPGATSGNVIELAADKDNGGLYTSGRTTTLTDQITAAPYGNFSAYISTATTTLVKTGAGMLHVVDIGETAAGAITIYDSVTATGTILQVYKASIAEGSHTLDIAFFNGLTVVTAAASKLTVSYR